MNVFSYPGNPSDERLLRFLEFWVFYTSKNENHEVKALLRKRNDFEL